MRNINSMQYSSMVVIFSALVFLNGCGSQDGHTAETNLQKVHAAKIDRTLPQYPSRYWDEELKQEMALLSAAERHLLEKFMSRHVKTSTTIEQVPIPEGATIKQAIFAQRELDSVLSQQQFEVNALREQIRKQDAEIVVLKNEVHSRDELVLNSREPASTNGINVPTIEAKRYYQAKQNALASYGVPELERQLQISMQKDRADPRWVEFQTDSPITASIRSRLIAAKQAAEESISSYVLSR